MVLLLLIVAIQKDHNEEIIGRIRSLDTRTQRDIMYFISSGLEKVQSLDKGIFISGEE